MEIYWVIDTKVHIDPRSSFPQDGSSFYLGRSVVPGTSKEKAIEKLKSAFEENLITVEEVIRSVDYESQSWNSETDADFKTESTFNAAKSSNDLALGHFLSEFWLED